LKLSNARNEGSETHEVGWQESSCLDRHAAPIYIHSGWKEKFALTKRNSWHLSGERRRLILLLHQLLKGDSILS
jgi:hypothetical protein